MMALNPWTAGWQADMRLVGVGGEAITAALRLAACTPASCRCQCVGGHITSISIIFCLLAHPLFSPTSLGKPPPLRWDLLVTWHLIVSTQVRGAAYSPAECMLRFRESCEIACNLTLSSLWPAYTGHRTGRPASLSSFPLPGQLMPSMLRVSLPVIPLESWPAHQKCTGSTMTASVANAADIRRRASLTGAVPLTQCLLRRAISTPKSAHRIPAMRPLPTSVLRRRQNRRSAFRRILDWRAALPHV